MSLTKIGSIGVSTGIQFAGVTTVSTLHVGSGVTLSSDGDIFATGITTVSGNVKVGTGITLSPDGDGFFTGIITATSYAGDGSALTGIDATQIVTGNTSVQTVDTGSDGHVKVNTEGSERLRIDSSGRLLHKHTASRNVGTKTGQIQVINSGNDAAISIIQTNNAGSAPFLAFGKTRSANTTGSTIVQDGDSLGQILFSGADGTDIDSTGATITAQVDGTPGSNDMPGRLIFSTTADGATTSTERLRIDSTGRLLLGTTTEGAGDADDLTIATTGNTGLTLRSGTSGYASVFFSDGTSGVDEYRGYVQYGHSSNMMILGTDGVERVRIQSDGKFGINTNSPAEMLHVNGTTQSTDYKYTSHPGHSAFTGDNSTTGFTIQSGHSVNSILVTYNGVVLKPTTDYTVSGTTLTTTFTPLTSSEIVVRYLIK